MNDRVSWIVMISVVIPIYNTEKYLSKCLESIINQTYQNLEIICVDDGSTDSSPKILEEYSKKDSRIKILSQPNSGQGVARNRGIDEASGDYIFFCDADDSLEPSAFEILVSKIEKTGADFVFFEANIYDSNSGKVSDNSYFGAGMYVDLFKEKDVFNYSDVPDLIFRAFAPWNKFFSLSFIRENNIKFCENLRFEDVAFHIKSFLLAHKIAYCDVCLYNYSCFLQSGCTEAFKNRKEALDIIGVVDIVETILENSAVEETLYRLFIRWKIDIFIYYYNNISDKALKKQFREKASLSFEKIKKKYSDEQLSKFIPEFSLKSIYRILKSKWFSSYRVCDYLYINIFFIKTRLRLRR